MNANPGHIALAQQAGFSALLPTNTTPADLRMELREAIHRVLGGVEQNLYSFLPSKAGSGASTIVFNAACALARERQKRVLVIDVNLRSGIQALLLDETPSGTVENLLSQASNIDTFLWTTAGRGRTMSTGCSPAQNRHAVPRVEHWFQVINFAKGATTLFWWTC